MRSIVCPLMVLCLGSAALWAGTDGFQAFTSEQARRFAVQVAPRSLPRVVLEDQDGVSFSLDEYRGRRLLVDFIYTRCRSICGGLSASFQRFAGEFADRGSAGPMLVSISFDPDVDTPAVLKGYADLFHANGNTWRFARITDKVKLAAMLRTFEVIVIPDALGGFQHNAAIHLVDQNGKLAVIFGYDEAEQAARAAAGVEP